jgi:hypothetical protein
MILVPNVLALFDQGSKPILRCEVFKTDGDTSTVDRPDNRYVYEGPQLKLIAAVWDKKFVGFESSMQKSRG